MKESGELRASRSPGDPLLDDHCGLLRERRSDSSNQLVDDAGRLAGPRALTVLLEDARNRAVVLGTKMRPLVQRFARAISQSLNRRSLSALPITLTDDSTMAAAAMIGESSKPKDG
jgi:hypothetical protein